MRLAAALSALASFIFCASSQPYDRYSVTTVGIFNLILKEKAEHSAKGKPDVYIEGRYDGIVSALFEALLLMNSTVSASGGKPFFCVPPQVSSLSLKTLAMQFEIDLVESAKTTDESASIVVAAIKGLARRYPCP
jgi:hypothetical protein